MEKGKGLMIVMVVVVLLALGVSLTSLLLLMKGNLNATSETANDSAKPKATLTYDVKAGEAIVSNLSQEKGKKPMMLRVAVTIEYNKGGFLHKPITNTLTARDKIIESIVTETINSTSADVVTENVEAAKKAFSEKLKERLQKEFGKDIYRVFTSEFIYN